MRIVRTTPNETRIVEINLSIECDSLRRSRIPTANWDQVVFAGVKVPIQEFFQILGTNRYQQ